MRAYAPVVCCAQGCPEMVHPVRILKGQLALVRLLKGHWDGGTHPVDKKTV